MRWAEFVFWGSLALALYAYGLYPLLIWLSSRLGRDPTAPHGAGGHAVDLASWPTVTLLIAAHRDEHVIVERLRNAVALDYPVSHLQIFVGCAGEEDLTGLLARSFDQRQVEVVQFPTRGEAFVLNACVRRARGDVLVFSDARTLMPPDALRQIARHFRDQGVGGVCGRLAPLDSAGSLRLGRRAWRFENFLKRCESRLGGLPEVQSGLYAIRRDLFQPICETSHVDHFAIAMQVRRQGFRLLYDERAVATADGAPMAEKSQRLPRMRAEVSRALSLLWTPGDFRRGATSFTFWLHKVIRRLCPGFLIGAFVSNATLSDNPFYLHCLLIHELVYVAALTGLCLAPGARRRRLWRGASHLLRMMYEGFRKSATGFPDRGAKTVAPEASSVPTRAAP